MTPPASPPGRRPPPARTAARALLPALLLALPAGLAAAPLLVEGKQTVYQRVLTRPGAELAEAPAGPAVQGFEPFEPLYVFGREEGWVQVGRSASGDPEGWVAAADVVDWRQNIVAAFTNPANRSRQLIFGDVAALRAHMDNETIRDWHRVLLEETDAGAPRDGFGVISVEPAEHIDIEQSFYVMPILGFEEAYHPLSRAPNILMNVASLPLDEPDPPAPPAGDFDVGVVLVIDTTQSMLPYFEVMRQQVQDLVARMAGSEISDRVNYGVVAFRDDNAGNPGIEYRVREMLSLERRASQDEVLAALAGLEAARVSTAGFNEDSLAAVAHALEEIDWEGGGDPFDARFVVLITDAGPRLPGQDGPSYDNTAEDLRAAAEAMGVSVLAVHLKTPAGEGGNHDYARDQYGTLTSLAGQPLYFPVEGGELAAFGAEVQRIVTFFRDQVAQAEGLAPDLAPEDLGEALAALGPAIRLQYLGTRQGTEAPEVFDGWLSRLSEDDGVRQAVSFRLLVTRNELATMADLVEEFMALSAALETDEDLARFHADIRAAVLRMSQDPNRLVDPGAEGIGDAMEFLEDLPYQSDLLRTSQDRWLANPVERQVAIDTLSSKLRSYRRWLSSPELWVPLFDGAADGEWVSALPVELLP